VKQEVSMHYLWVAIIGLIVGALAKLIMPGKDPGGIIVTMLLGLAGSFLATLIGGLSVCIARAKPRVLSCP
jgi:uncharacterized membrane protein YeaQ/YmgE (transglycosylase-associated protein family)